MVIRDMSSICLFMSKAYRTASISENGYGCMYPSPHFKRCFPGQCTTRCKKKCPCVLMSGRSARPSFNPSKLNMTLPSVYNDARSHELVISLFSGGSKCVQILRYDEVLTNESKAHPRSRRCRA